MAQHRIAEITQSITRIAPTLIVKVGQYKAFINSVFTSYEYRRTERARALTRRTRSY